MASAPRMPSAAMSSSPAASPTTTSIPATATEGSRALVRKGFLELGTERVTATALAANRASVRVMEKAGLRFDHDYIHEHTDPETGLVTGHPAVKYALDSAEFEA